MKPRLSYLPIILLLSTNAYSADPASGTEIPGGVDETVPAAPAVSGTSLGPAPSPIPSPSPSTSVLPTEISTTEPISPGWPTSRKKPLALWRSTLPKKPSKAAVEMARALKALAEGKFPQVRKIVKPFFTHADFADHALFLDGKAGVFEARTKIEKKPNEANQLAQNAIRSFEKIRSQYLLSPWYSRVPEFIGQAEMIRGRALVSAKKMKDALLVLERGFQRLLLENAIHLSTSEALSAYAKACLAKRSNLCEAWVLRLANQFAKNTLESRTLAESFKETVGQAKPNFANSKVTVGYKQKDSDEVAFDLAFQNVLQRKWSASVKAFRKFLDDFPKSTHRYRARYWLARATEEDDGAGKANPIFETVAKESPLTFYGLLSQWKLGLDPLSRYSANSPHLQEDDVFQTPQEVVRVVRAGDLIAAGAMELAAMDLRDLKPRDTATGGYLLYLAGMNTLAGAYLASFTTLTELIQRSDELVYSGDTLDLVFPIVDESLVKKGAETAELDPLLVLSLMKQESGFEKDIHSGVGASGYMQLMPFTASDVEPDVKREDLLNAETNIRIGSKYLKRMLNRYQGNAALALAAYNAGPGAVDRWVKDGRADLGFNEWVEQIPYKETREYVGTIFRNFVYYQRKLNGKTLTDTEAFWPSGWKPKK